MTQSAIDAAIAQATANAASFNPNPVVVQTAPTSVTTYTNPGTASPLSVNDMLQGSLDVAGWLKVSHFGFSIGSDTTMFDRISVRMEMDEIMWNFTLRYGSPAQYEKTYDHVTDVKGRPWVAVVQQVQMIDPKASEFRSADIPFYPREALLNKKGELIIPEGAAMGHSISQTGFKYLTKFIRAADKAGLDIHTGSINVDIVHNPESNDKGKWGTIRFENFSAA